MNEEDPIVIYLSRPDNLVTAMEIQRALKRWKQGGPSALEPPIVQVFNDQSNLRLAETIAENVKAIKKTLLLEFSAKLKHKLHNVVNENDSGGGWELKLAYHEPWTKDYAGWGLYPKSDEGVGDAPYLWPCIQRTKNWMNYGISYSEDPSKRPNVWELQEVVELQSQLMREGLRGGGWWLRYKAMYDFREDEFYLKAASRMEGLVDEVVEDFWNIFTENRELMEKANKALYRKNTVE